MPGLVGLSKLLNAISNDNKILIKSDLLPLQVVMTLGARNNRFNLDTEMNYYMIVENALENYAFAL